MDCAAMILAAGFGTRLAPFTKHTPKPLFPFFDVPLIRYGLDRLAERNCASIVVNLHCGAALLADYLRGLEGSLVTKSRTPVAIHLSSEETLLGTGGGIAAARKYFGSKTLLVVNSDVLFEFDLEQLLAFHRDRDALATVLLHSGEGREWLRSTASGDDGRLTSIHKAGPEDPSRGVFSGIYVLEPEVWRELPSKPSSVVTEGFVPAMEQGRAFGLKKTFPWWDLGTWSACHKACMQVLDDSMLPCPDGSDFMRLFSLSPGRFLEGGFGPLYVGLGTELPRSVVASSGWAVVGADCNVARGATLRRTVVLPRSSVSGHVLDCVTGSGFTVKSN